MAEKQAAPGVSRDDRISDEGLSRLERQMQQGAPISGVVLAQWVKRYGEPARVILRRHGRYDSDFDSL